MKKILVLFFIFLCPLFLFSQSIKGIIKDENGLGIPGANISNSITKDNASSDLDGNFTINGNEKDNLKVSFIGYETAYIKAANNMVVILKAENNILKEVVVVGYGSKKVGAITGSVVQIKSADITKTPAQSAIQSIQGKAAGVNIVTNDEPGSNPTIRIRGLGTLLGSRDPLYVIDGIEASGLNGLNPNEIATIDILKDASSIAIYGQKGSNGVVIVSTKKGKSGEIKVNYNAFYGQKFIQKTVDMSDSYKYAYYNNSALGSTSYFNFTQPYNTNWLNEITSTGETINNYISLSGGNETATYYFGASNYKEKGILNGTEFERTNINSRNEFKLLNNTIKISPAINLSITNNSPKPLSAFTNAYKQSPIVPVQFSNGRWGVPLRDPNTGLVDISGSDRFNNVGNPAAQLYFTNEQNKNVTLFGSIGGEFQLTKDLKFNSNFGATFDWSRGYTFSPSRDIFLSQNPSKEIEDYPLASPINTLNQRRGSSYRWNWDNFATYKKEYGKHEVTFVAGMSRTTSNISENLSGTRWNVPEQSNYWALDFSSYNANQGSFVSNSNSTPIVSIAYFARAEYEFDNKYLLSATIRREGNSVFQNSKRWANLPAISAGWIISEEDFMQNSKLFNFLKIRGGYGEVGNANSLNSLNNLVFSSGNNYAFGTDQNIYAGNNQPFQIDPNLTWETMREIDFGIDFKAFKNNLSGTIDVYDRKSSDVILPVSLPAVLSPERVVLNTGDVSNKGAELSLKWSDEINDKISYYVSGNISYNKNKLEKVSNSYFSDYIGGSINNGQWTKKVIVGEALGSFYVYDVLGLNSDGAFIYSDERVVAGSYLPKYTYGFSFGANYKNIDFSVDAYGVGGNKIYNGKKAQRFGGENIESAVLNNFWTPSNPNALNPYPFNQVPVSSTYYIEDGAYLRINNITLGYTLPKLNKIINKIRIYATAVNPFIFTKFTGYSPELSGGSNGDPLGNAGIELDAYPTNKSFVLGLNVSF